MNRESRTPHDATVADILLVGAALGLVAGLVEGAALFVFQNFGWFGWGKASAVSVQVLWISALAYLVLFTCIALGLAVLKWLFGRLWDRRLPVAIFSVLTIYAWLAVTGVGWISRFALLMLSFGLASAFVRWLGERLSNFTRFSRRSVPWIALAALLVILGTEGRVRLHEGLVEGALPSRVPDDPNILFIILDAVRADHLSSYGYSRATSPNLDQIARQGVLFEAAFSTSSWTLPSHTSLLTGRYPHEHGAEELWNQSYDGRNPVIGNSLQRRGYRTGGFSANPSYFTRSVGLDRGFIHFEDQRTVRSVRDALSRTIYGREFDHLNKRAFGNQGELGRRWAPEMVRSLLNWIGTAKDRPFFVVVNLFDAHDPYSPPEPFRSRFTALKTSKQAGDEVDLYDGAIASIDDQIGQLFAELRKRHLDENMLVVITADHGESFGEHGLFTHHYALYRESIHVPLIISWPGRIPTGVRVEQPVTTAALPATLLELLGGGEEKVFPGPSLTELWSPREIHSEWPYPLSELAKMPPEEGKNAPAFHGSAKSLIGGEWHYITHQKLGEELYRWRDDPQEVNNLAATPEGQLIVRDFRDRIASLFPKD